MVSSSWEAMLSKKVGGWEPYGLVEMRTIVEQRQEAGKGEIGSMMLNEEEKTEIFRIGSLDICFAGKEKKKKRNENQTGETRHYNDGQWQTRRKR